MYNKNNIKNNYMKNNLVILITCLFISCGNPQTNEQSLEISNPVIAKITSVDNNSIREIKLYIIDSCEYIGHINNYYSDFLTHKGNCKFCAKRKLKN